MTIYSHHELNMPRTDKTPALGNDVFFYQDLIGET